MWVLGVLMGKAIFDRISINCRLNHTIIRQLCSQALHINDVYSFDRKFYESWKTILNSSGIDNYFLTFSEIKTHEDGTTEEINLLKD